MLGASTFFVLSSQIDDDELPGPVLAAGGLLVGGALLLLAGAVGVLPFAVAAAPVAFATVFGGVVLPWWVVVPVLGAAGDSEEVCAN